MADSPVHRLPQLGGAYHRCAALADSPVHRQHTLGEPAISVQSRCRESFVLRS